MRSETFTLPRARFMSFLAVKNSQTQVFLAVLSTTPSYLSNAMLGSSIEVVFTMLQVRKVHEKCDLEIPNPEKCNFQNFEINFFEVLLTFPRGTRALEPPRLIFRTFTLSFWFFEKSTFFRIWDPRSHFS